MSNKENFPDKEYMKEALSFYKSGKIIQSSEMRLNDEQLLSGPIIYLFRHTVELLLKALIIRDAVDQGISKWNTYLFPPNMRSISSMHSIKALYESWKDLLSYKLISPIEKVDTNRLLEVINRIEKCDSSSTFFRYPFDKKTNKNNKVFAEDMDEEKLYSLPCSIGAIVHHEGPENFKCGRGDEQVAWLELDLDWLIERLYLYYTGKELFGINSEVTFDTI